MLQSYTSIVNGSLQFGHISWTKLQPSLVYDIAPQWSVQIGGFITVAGIDARDPAASETDVSARAAVKDRKLLGAHA
jgi:hypothetical protein